MRIDEYSKGFDWLTKAMSELNPFASMRVTRGKTWLAGILILLLAVTRVVPSSSHNASFEKGSACSRKF
jgi:hypothetical protein